MDVKHLVQDIRQILFAGIIHAGMIKKYNQLDALCFKASGAFTILLPGTIWSRPGLVPIVGPSVVLFVFVIHYQCFKSGTKEFMPEQQVFEWREGGPMGQAAHIVMFVADCMGPPLPLATAYGERGWVIKRSVPNDVN